MDGNRGILAIDVGSGTQDILVWRPEESYEHHTSLLDTPRFKDHLDRFRRGDLTNREIFDEMGHGCHILARAGEASPFAHLSLTGPNRERFAEIEGHMAAPYGDMMLTGCFGLLEAVKEKTEKNGDGEREGCNAS